MNELDGVQLNYDVDNILIVNISLAFIMFGVALGLTVEAFKNVLSQKKPVLVGLLSQFVVLPLLTFLLVLIFEPMPSVALGMMMVAACPGGNISNFISSYSQGNAALSVSLTAVSSILAIFMTPLNLSLWGSLYGPTAEILQVVSLDILQVFRTIVLILGLPIVAGMLVRRYFPKTTQKVQPVMTITSILIFSGLVVGAFAANYQIFLEYIQYVLLIVFLHNAVALLSGYQLATFFGLSQRDRRSLSIETGIQNSGLGLLLIFSFFGGLGGMAIVAGWWGIWHIISGLALGTWWNRRPIAQLA
ncbi:MAG: bile acid:sodium symporter family protein [Bacteroidota bacterium]